MHRAPPYTVQHGDCQTDRGTGSSLATETTTGQLCVNRSSCGRGQMDGSGTSHVLHLASVSRVTEPAAHYCFMYRAAVCLGLIGTSKLIESLSPRSLALSVAVALEALCLICSANAALTIV
uniref:Uncharacterized protein n=1 Tax=Anopheles coluzzii TaxID=1518534 RepID=A0A8W7PZB8_ANOCL